MKMKHLEAYLDLNFCFETYSDMKKTTKYEGLSDVMKNILSDNNIIYTKHVTYYSNYP